MSSARDEVIEPAPRFRLLRIVTVEGTTDMTDERGDARGGVRTGAGSLERTLWTRASRRCICAVRERMWVSELEVGSLCEAERGTVVREGAGVRVFVTARAPDGRIPVLVRALGLGVTLRSAEGMRDLVAAGVRSLFLDPGLGSVDEVSDRGGEGGS